MNKSKPLVAIVMGSNSDWPVMEKSAKILEDFGIPYEAKVVSAHRTPHLMFEFAENAKKKGFKIIIAGAGGAAHLPGMIAAKTTLPVLGIPIPTKHLEGQDSLLSIVQMPKGIPVGTLAIGDDGAINAALLAAAIIANNDPVIRNKLKKFRTEQTKSVKKIPK